ncbi:unnamed protein product, partial [Rotaria sp. Silwood1]
HPIVTPIIIPPEEVIGDAPWTDKHFVDLAIE